MSDAGTGSPVAGVPSAPVASFDDVFVLFGNVVALRGLSLELYGGERVVVRGPSGSGKSTLVNVVTGQMQPTAGVLSFSFEGRVVSGDALSRGSLPRLLSVITQGSGRELIPEINCERNVALTMELSGAPRSQALDRARELLARFEVSHLANRMPTDISSGEAQRVALAAALSASPSIIVADEPTGELDRVSADQVYALLSAHVEATRAALLLVSHDERAEAIADRVLSIRDGRLERVRQRDSVASTFVIDPRGWMRLPEPERLAVGISGGAIITLTDDKTALRVERSESLREPTTPDGVSSASESDGSGELIANGVDVAVVIHDVVALAPVSFSVRRGELTVIAGPSGSGKTTLLSVLGELRAPSAGSVQWLAKPSKVFAAQVAGFAEDASVRENVLLTSSLRNGTKSETELVDLLRALGIELLIDRPMRTMSGGERQRAGVARAILCSAELMLIDEPTSQLDEVSAGRTIEQLVATARRGVAVVVASHDETLIAAADAIIAL
jgi:ABC-type lipoprotein export system ATPase subunit